MCPEDKACKKFGLLHRRRIQEGTRCKSNNSLCKMFPEHMAIFQDLVCSTCLEGKQSMYSHFPLRTPRHCKQYRPTPLLLKTNLPCTAVDCSAFHHAHLDSNIRRDMSCKPMPVGLTDIRQSILSSFAAHPPKTNRLDRAVGADMVHKTRPEGMASTGFDFSWRKILEHTRRTQHPRPR